MRHVSNAFAVPGLVIAVLIAAGCATSRQTAETNTSPTPFVRTLDDPADYHLLLTGLPQTCGMRSGRVRLAPGKSIGLHNTKGNEELLVFLAGRGTAVIGERPPPGGGSGPHRLHSAADRPRHREYRDRAAGLCLLCCPGGSGQDAVNSLVNRTAGS